MQTYYFTFGQQHVHPETGEKMRNYWVEIFAANSEEARITMFNIYGAKWSFQYTQDDFKPEYFPSGCYEKIIHPA